MKSKSKSPLSSRKKIPSRLYSIKTKWNVLQLDDYAEQNELEQTEFLNKNLDKLDTDIKKYMEYVNKTKSIHPKIYNKIINHLIEKRKPLLSIYKIDFENIPIELFKLYSDKDKIGFIELNIDKLIANDSNKLEKLVSLVPFKLLNTKTQYKLAQYLIELNKSTLMNTSFDDITFAMFTKEVNPYMKLYYLRDNIDKSSSSKWRKLFSHFETEHKSIPEIYSSKDYKELIKEYTTSSIKNKKDSINVDGTACMNDYSHKELIELAYAKYGGDINYYSKLPPEIICSMIVNPSSPKLTKKFDKTMFKLADELTPRYLADFKNQIDYINSLNNTAKESILVYRNKYSKQEDKIKIQKILDNIFKYSPPTTEDIFIYKSIDSEDKILYTDKQNKDYITATSEYNIAEDELKSNRNQSLLMIKIPAGTHVLPIAIISSNPSKHELMLFRNGMFRTINQVGNKQLVTMYIEDTKLYKNLIPVKIYEEYIVTLNLLFRGPKYVNSVVRSTFGDDFNIIESFKYLISACLYRYSTKDLPYITVIKNITQTYEDTEFIMEIETNKKIHLLTIRNGKIYEDNKLIE